MRLSTPKIMRLSQTEKLCNGPLTNEALNETLFRDRFKRTCCKEKENWAEMRAGSETRGKSKRIKRKKAKLEDEIAKLFEKETEGKLAQSEQEIAFLRENFKEMKDLVGTLSQKPCCQHNSSCGCSSAHVPTHQELLILQQEKKNILDKLALAQNQLSHSEEQKELVIAEFKSQIKQMEIQNYNKEHQNEISFKTQELHFNKIIEQSNLQYSELQINHKKVKEEFEIIFCENEKFKNEINKLNNQIKIIENEFNEQKEFFEEKIKKTEKKIGTMTNEFEQEKFTKEKNYEIKKIAYEKEILQLNNSLLSQINEMKEITFESEKKEKKIIELETITQSMMVEKIELHKKVEKLLVLEKEVISLTNENTNIVNEYESFTLEHEELVLEHNKLIEEHEEVVKNSNEITKEHKQLNEKHEVLRNDYNVITIEYENLQQEQKTTLGSFSLLETEHKALITEYTEHINIFSSYHALFNENLQKKTNELTQCILSLNNLKVNLEAYVEKYAFLESTIDHTELKCKDIESSIETYVLQLESTVTSYHEDLFIEKKQAQCTQHEYEIILRELKNVVNEQNVEINKKKTQIEQLEHEIIINKTEVNHIQLSLQQTKLDLHQSNCELIQTKNELKEKMNKTEELKKVVREIRDDTIHTQHEVSQYEIEIEEYEIENNELKKIIAENSIEAAKNKINIDALNEQNYEANIKIKELKEEINALQEQLIIKQTVIHEIDLQCASLTSEKKLLEMENERKEKYFEMEMESKEKILFMQIENKEKEKEREIEQKEKEINEIKQEYYHKNNEIEQEHQRELISLRHEKEKETSSMNEFREKVKKFELTIELLEKEIKTITIEKENVSLQLAHSLNNRENIEVQFKKIITQKDSISKKLEEEEASIENLKSQLKFQEQKINFLSEQLFNKSEEVISLQIKNKQEETIYENNIKKEKSIIEEMKNQLEKIHEREILLHQELKLKEETHTKELNEIYTLCDKNKNDTVSILKNKISTLISEKESILAKLEIKTAELDECGEKLLSVSEVLNENHSLLTFEREERQKLLRDLEDKKEQNKQTERLLKQLKLQNENYKKEIEDSIQYKENTIETYRKENENKLKEKENIIEDLKIEKQNCKRELERCQRELEKHNRETENDKKEILKYEREIENKSYEIVNLKRELEREQNSTKEMKIRLENIKNNYECTIEEFKTKTQFSTIDIKKNNSEEIELLQKTIKILKQENENIEKVMNEQIKQRNTIIEQLMQEKNILYSQITTKSHLS